MNLKEKKETLQDKIEQEKSALVLKNQMPINQSDCYGFGNSF